MRVLRRASEHRRIHITLTRKGAELLAQLLSTGLYGRNMSEAARRLIEEGLQRRARPKPEASA